MDDAAARRARRAGWPVKVTTLEAEGDVPTMEGRPLEAIFAAVEELSRVAFALAGKRPLERPRGEWPSRLYRPGEPRPSSDEDDPLAHGLE